MHILTEDDIRYARNIAKQIARGAYSSLFHEDLIEAGVEAAIAAARTHDEGSAPFKSYLYLRVRGGVIDEFRKLIARRGVQRPGSAVGVLPEQTDQSPPVDEAAILSLTLVELFPNERHRQVIVERFFRDRTQPEIAEMLGVTKARVCQIEREALTKARELAQG